MKLISFKLVIFAVRSWLLKANRMEAKCRAIFLRNKSCFPRTRLMFQHLSLYQRTSLRFNTFLYCICFWTAPKLLVLALYRTFDAYEYGQYVTGSVAILCKSFKTWKITALLQNMHKYSNVCRNLHREIKSMGKEKLRVQNTKNNWLRLSKYSGSEIGSQTLKSLKSIRRRDQN